MMHTTKTEMTSRDRINLRRRGKAAVTVGSDAARRSFQADGQKKDGDRSRRWRDPDRHHRRCDHERHQQRDAERQAVGRRRRTGWAGGHRHPDPERDDQQRDQHDQPDDGELPAHGRHASTGGLTGRRQPSAPHGATVSPLAPAGPHAVGLGSHLDGSQLPTRVDVADDKPAVRVVGDDVHRPDAKDEDGAGAVVGDPANRPSGVKSR